MSAPTITTLPTPPSTSDPSNFATRADAFLAALPTFVTEANALAAYYEATGLSNAATLESQTWEAPGTIGSVTPNSVAASTFAASGTATFGSGTTTNTGFQFVYGSSGITSGWGGVYGLGVTPGASNFSVGIKQDCSAVALNAITGGSITHQINGSVVTTTSGAGFAVTGTLTVKSGAIGTANTVVVGRTGSDSVWGVAAASDDVVNNSVAGDTCFNANVASANILWAINGAELMRLDSGGLLRAGGLKAKSSGGGALSWVWTDDVALISTNANGSGGAGWNAAVSVLNVRADTVTSRSINAGGTINASGADYAEYETKADTCGAVAKGQIIGVNASGKITDKWADAIRFGVKSTSPNLVGGDSWGSESAIGAQPRLPAYDAPEYVGPDKPEALAALHEAPVLASVAVPEEPVPPAEPTRGSMSDVEWARAVNVYVMSDMAYRVALNVRGRAIEAQAAAAQAYADALAAWTAEKQAHDAAAAQYQADLEAWQAAQDAHAAAVQAAQDAHSAALAQYEADLAAFESTLEAARVKVDRIAYAGKVPCNITGATVGDYIIATAAADGGITGTAVADPDFAQYRKAVGRVNRILEDGRAEIAVIVH